MNRLLVIAALAASLAAAPASAARIGVAKVDDSYALFLRGDELNGQFDTVDLSMTESSPYTLSNIVSGLNMGVPRAPGEQFTFVNRQLDQDVLDGGLGWSIVGRIVNANGLAFAGGPLGSTIDTRRGGRQGWLFLANFLPSPAENRYFPGTLRVQLIRAGNIVAELPLLLDGFIPLPEVPEPATGVLGCASLLGLAGLRRGTTQRSQT